MKKSYKKIIAREFLIFLTSAVTFFIILFIWIKLSDSNAEKREVLTNEIERLENIDVTNLQTIYYNENLNNLYDVILQRNLYNKSLADFKLEMTSKSSQVELYKLVHIKKLYTKTQSEFLEKYFQTKKVPISKILMDYVATANSPKYNSDWNIINSKFPELKEFDEGILQEYVATANNTEYNGDWKIINSKFPEFGFQKSNSDINTLKKLSDFKTKLQKEEESFFKNSVTENDLLALAVIILLFFFGFRYLIYGIKWSIRQLRE
jgi:hypothetical protein